MKQKSAVFTTTLVQVSLCLSWWKEWVLLTRPYGISSCRCAMQYVVYHSTLNLGRWRTGFHLHLKKKFAQLGGALQHLYNFLYVMLHIWKAVNWICTSPLGIIHCSTVIFSGIPWEEHFIVCFHVGFCDNDLTTVIPNCRHHPTEGFAVYFFFIHVSAIKADTPCLNYNYSLDRNLLLLGFYH